MNVHDIILKEQQLDEKPTSSIGNFAKKVASKVTTGGTSARLGGSAEMGSKANQIYKDLARWQGINQKNDKNMTAADLAAFMKQHDLSAGGMKLPDGILPKKIIDDALKKAAAGSLTGGNTAPSGGDSAAQKAGSALGGAMDAMAQGAGVKPTAMKGSTGKMGAGAPGGSAGAGTGTDPKVSQLKTKGGITPDIQAMIDKLTPTEKKALAGAI